MSLAQSWPGGDSIFRARTKTLSDPRKKEDAFVMEPQPSTAFEPLVAQSYSSFLAFVSHFFCLSLFPPDASPFEMRTSPFGCAIEKNSDASHTTPKRLSKLLPYVYLLETDLKGSFSLNDESTVLKIEEKRMKPQRRKMI